MVVMIEPNIRFMDRCGLATGTRKVAARLWGESIPEGEPWKLMRELYAAENEGLVHPSGSQDMAGLLFPGINRLDYDASHEGGYFPCHIESSVCPDVAAWLEKVIHVVPVSPRPQGYNPLCVQCLSPWLAQQLGGTGKACYDAIVGQDIHGLAKSFNDCMDIWEAMLPAIVDHPVLTVDLRKMLKVYQDAYPGAMYSGCGGGYLYVVSEEPVPGSFSIKVKLK